MEAILDAERKVDRAFKAGALALGATVEIETLPGYLPMRCDPIMARYFRETAGALVGEEHYRQVGHRTGSTDMGDLSQVMPILHPYMGGATGSGHGADYAIVDKTLAYVTLAKSLAAMAVDMLADGAQGAREVLAQARPPMTREAFPRVPARARAPGDVLGLSAPAAMYGQAGVDFPRRIVCLSADTAEIAFLVGAGERVVGVPGTARRPEAARERARVGGFTTFRLDRILALEPDLVLAFSDLQREIVSELIGAGRQRALHESAVVRRGPGGHPPGGRRPRLRGRRARPRGGHDRRGAPDPGVLERLARSPARLLRGVARSPDRRAFAGCPS